MDGEDVFEPAIFSNVKKTKAVQKPTEEIPKITTENTVIGSQRPNTFEALGLEPVFLETLRGLSLRQPTPVQQACIPELLARSGPVVGVAQTGSGKTAAFALPILQNLSHDQYGVFAVIMTPTRELAIQIAEQFKAFAKGFPLHVMLALGGVDMMKQAAELHSRPHIVIATPGRLADLLLNSDGRQFKRVAYLVFDEADRLLGDAASFGADLGVIIDAMRGPQTVLSAFTATITDAVLQFFPQKPFVFNPIASGEVAAKTVKDLDQRFLLVPSQVRDVILYKLLTIDFCKTPSLIIFVNKCLTCELLRRMLALLDIRTAALHSQLSQQSRLTALAKFKSMQCRILIATDVAARGLDIPEVELVLNYDVPADYRDYVHRVGRTARAGRRGMALTLVGEMDVALVQNLEEHVGITLEDHPTPEEKGILDDLTKVSDAKRLASMALRENKFGEKRKRNQEKWRKVNDSALATQKVKKTNKMKKIKDDK